MGLHSKKSLEGSISGGGFVLEYVAAGLRVPYLQSCTFPAGFGQNLEVIINSLRGREILK